MTDPCDVPIVGSREMAELLGVRPQHVSRLISRSKIPKPDRRLKAGPVWFLTDELQDTIDDYRSDNP